MKALSQASDYELVSRLQRSPSKGQYFTALFCRYSPVVYSLIRHSARSPVQADYLFALTWRHILNELGGLDLAPPADESPADESRVKEFSLQNWLINLTAAHINQAVMPEIESIHYALQAAPPPLWCYTERALESLLPEHRLMVLMAQTFEWSDTRIAAYLQAEGTQISPQEVRLELKVAYAALERAIPADIREIYLDHPPPIAPAIADELAGLLTIEFDEVDLQV
jgi:hypothetical protein